MLLKVDYYLLFNFVFFVVIIMVERLQTNFNGKLVWLEGKILSFIRERKNVKDHGTDGFSFQETFPNDVATNFITRSNEEDAVMKTIIQMLSLQ
ncbi:hypothetical protein OH784_26910 [Ectobacillus funiculus]|uniref:hypothetical protein n=1 Tax=Ectobacillus funiculus TaxID=137993 RepID=UPI003979EB8B